MQLDRTRLSFNTGNMTGSIACKLAAIHEAGFGGTTMWPADFFVHFEDLDTNLEHVRASPLEHFPPDVGQAAYPACRK